jgi:hypothetical protein
MTLTTVAKFIKTFIGIIYASTGERYCDENAVNYSQIKFLT